MLDDLVDRVCHWPGVNGLAALLNGRTLRARRPLHFFRRDGAMPEELELAVTLPAELGPAGDVLAELRERVRAVEDERCAERQRTGRRVLGRRAVLAQSWRERPDDAGARKGLPPTSSISGFMPGRLTAERNAGPRCVNARTSSNGAEGTRQVSAGATCQPSGKFCTKSEIPVTHGNLDNVRGERYGASMLDRKRLEPLVAQISEVLQTKPMRNAEVLQAAKINDYRAGEDAIWELVQQGRVRVEADSTLTWVASNEEKRPRGAGAAARGASSRQDRTQKRP